MSRITTHVLDISSGRPAGGMGAALYGREGGEVFRGRTNADGRIADWGEVGEGIYKIRFETGDYFDRQGVKSFYPFVEVSFVVGEGHYHIPLLLSPWGYSTYRGS